MGLEITLCDIPSEYHIPFNHLRDKELLAFKIVKKVNKLLKEEVRVFVMSVNTIYMYKKDGTMTRCIPIEAIKKLELLNEIMALTNSFPDYDLVVKFNKPKTADGICRVIQSLYYNLHDCKEYLAFEDVTTTGEDLNWDKLHLNKPINWKLVKRGINDKGNKSFITIEKGVSTSKFESRLNLGKSLAMSINPFSTVCTPSTQGGPTPMNTFGDTYQSDPNTHEAVSITNNSIINSNANKTSNTDTDLKSIIEKQQALLAQQQQIIIQQQNVFNQQINKSDISSMCSNTPSHMVNNQSGLYATRGYHQPYTPHQPLILVPRIKNPITEHNLTQQISNTVQQDYRDMNSYNTYPSNNLNKNYNNINYNINSNRMHNVHSSRESPKKSKYQNEMHDTYERFIQKKMVPRYTKPSDSKHYYDKPVNNYY